MSGPLVRAREKFANKKMPPSKNAIIVSSRLHSVHSACRKTSFRNPDPERHLQQDQEERVLRALQSGHTRKDIHLEVASGTS